MVIFGKVQTDKDGISHCEIRIPSFSMRVKIVFQPVQTLPDTGMHDRPGPSRRSQRGCVLHPLCGALKCIHQPDWEVPQHRVCEHRRAVKNGDVKAFTLAEHVFKTGYAVDLSRSKVLSHHQHSTTCWYIQNNQAVLNREWRTLPEVYVVLLD